MLEGVLKGGPIMEIGKPTAEPPALCWGSHVCFVAQMDTKSG